MVMFSDSTELDTRKSNSMCQYLSPHMTLSIFVSSTVSEYVSFIMNYMNTNSYFWILNTTSHT